MATWDDAGEWVSDGRGNRCSVAYFGSRDAARAALDRLKNCDNCTNCSDCSRCSGCSGCSDCSGCSHIAHLYNRENLQAEPLAEGQTIGAPPVPAIPDIHQAIYAAVTKPKALDMSDWHTCDTTHCRAGWAVHLAGPAGYALEKFHNTELAAMLIYSASGSPINPARFHDSNTAAMGDMRALAEAEASK